MSFTALILAAAASAASPPEPGTGALLASAQVQVVIVKAAIVRQATGVEQLRDAPAPQLTRRDGAVLVEYQ